MGLIPKVVWFNGCLGVTRMILTLPFFLFLFCLSVAFWPIPVIYCLCSNIVLCRAPSVGRDVMDSFLPILEVVLTIFVTRNPLCPFGVMANVGKWVMCLLSLLMYAAGLSFNACRKKEEGKNVVKVTDPNCYEVIEVDEHVTVVNAKFSEGLESVCTMTVIKYNDYVLFWNPVFLPAEIYQKLMGDKKPICFICTTFHHMAAWIMIEACGGIDKVKVWGTSASSDRNPRYLPIEEPKPLPGITYFYLPGTIYDEWWAHFAPSKILLQGDLMPGLDGAFPFGPIQLGLIKCAHCADPCSAFSYSRCLIIDHSSTTEVIKQVLAFDITRIEGAHAPDSKLLADAHMVRDPNCKGALLTFWRWLLPSKMYDQSVFLFEG